MTSYKTPIALPLVLGRTAAKKWQYRRGPQIKAIQILDPEGSNFPSLGIPSLRLRFHDVTLSELREDPQWVGPELGHCEQIIQFVGDTSPDRVLVHCFAGISRSTAAALLILAQYHGQAAFPRVVKEFYRKYPQASPNELMLQHGAKLLGWDIFAVANNFHPAGRPRATGEAEVALPPP